jgi:geranylgeranyl diphosphate synthase, type I
MMDLYARIQAHLASQPVFQTWPDMHSILERASATRPHDWQLPLLTCQAVGGAPESALAGACAIACAQISIILIDSMLDGEPNGEHQRLGQPAAANLALAFQAAALEALAATDREPTARLAALQAVNAMALTTALGQYLDTQNPADEAAYWRVVKTKSAPFFGAAFQVGALLGGARLDVAEQLKTLGHLYGEMIQIHDDLNDTLAIPANPDWTLNRSPLTILFAQVVEHPERKRFLELRARLNQAVDPEALAEAQSILIQSGAVSYGVAQLLSRHQQATSLLGAIQLQDTQGMVALLEELVTPIWKLFESLGSPRSTLALEQVA